MLNVVRWIMATLAVLLATVPPVALYRYQYVQAKRFHEVIPGRFYRSGQMTAAGFREIVEKYKIKLFINLHQEEPAPYLANHWLGEGKILESDLCRELGVKYVLLTPDLLPPDNRLDMIPPPVDEFLKLLDDESNYPILLHCKAGLHRTGRLTAIYRMEFQGWTSGEAIREARANGYGYIMASEFDPYVIQFLQNYVPRKDRPKPQAMLPVPSQPEPFKPGIVSGSGKGGGG
jgi:tyrosine-protein phosphatase SIW14